MLQGNVRSVEYTDDGCMVFQCLCCYGTFEIRGHVYCHYTKPKWQFRYCPKCGIRFEVYHDSAEQKDEMQSLKDRYWDNYKREQERINKSKHWIIETRFSDAHLWGNLYNDWKEEVRFSLYNYTAHNIKKIVDERAQFYNWKEDGIEWRVRLDYID